MLEFKRLKIDLRLPDFVQGIWSLKSQSAEVKLELVPDGYPELIIPIYGSAISKVGSEVSTIDKPMIIGQANKLAMISLRSCSYFISIKLYQWYLGDFTNGNAKASLNTAIPFENLYPSLTECINIFIERINENQNLEKLIHQLVWQINAKIAFKFLPFLKYDISSKMDDIKNLISLQKPSNLNFSQRYLQKKYAEHIGISPKQLEKIFRVKKFSLLMSEINPYTLPQLSNMLDYYDLSHFYKDFKSVTAQNPYQHLKKNEFFYSNKAYLRQWDYS